VTYHESTGKRQIKITPNRAKAIRSLSRRSYKAATSKFYQLPQTKDYLLKDFVKCVNGEIRNICSINHNSVLRGSHQNIKNFSWVAIWDELTKNVPTLVNFLNRLLPKSNKRFIVFLICAIIKKKCKQMSLIQRVFSFLLYSNAAKKQVRSRKYHYILVCYYGVFIRYTDIYSHLWCA